MPLYRIVVEVGKKQLSLYDDEHLIHRYPIGIGRMVTRTPVGDYMIVNKEPNPGGPYGVYWMGLSKEHYGIHGTDAPSSIGKESSHGCIRMLNQDILELQKWVKVGTPVQIIP